MPTVYNSFVSVNPKKKKKTGGKYEVIQGGCCSCWACRTLTASLCIKGSDCLMSPNSRSELQDGSSLQDEETCNKTAALRN